MSSELDPSWKVTGEETTRGYERNFTLQNAMVPVGTLSLDPDNARLFSTKMGKYGGKDLTQEELRDELWGNPAVKQLYRSIESAGGLSEALYVTRTGRVVEGNERLTALLKIKEKITEEESYSEAQLNSLKNLVENVPVKVLPVDLSPRERSMMLADWHLGGKDSWSSFDQAQHIHQMHHSEAISVEDIAQRLRKSRTWVYQKLKAYEMTKEHFERSGRWEHTKEFSFFEELYKKKKILKDVPGGNGIDWENEDDLHKFMDWISSGSLVRALDVRKLNKILEHDETRELLEEGKGEEAFNLLSIIDASESSPRFAAMERLNNQLKKMNWDEYRLISKEGSHRSLIEDTIGRLQKVLEISEDAKWDFGER